MFVFALLLCSVAGNPMSTESDNSRDSRQLFRYRVPWSQPASFYNAVGNNGFDIQNDNSEEKLIDSLSSDAVKWMQNLKQNDQERLISWTLASAAVSRLIQGKPPGSTAPFDRSGSYFYNGAISSNRQYYSNIGSGLQRYPYGPLPLFDDAEPRTFFLIQQIVQNVANAIQQCQVGVFSPLIASCGQQKTTTTTPAITTTAMETTT